MFREADLSQDESKAQIYSAYFWKGEKEGNHFDQFVWPGGAPRAPLTSPSPVGHNSNPADGRSVVRGLYSIANMRADTRRSQFHQSSTYL